MQNNQLEQLVLNLEGQRESERKKLEEANRSTYTAAQQQVANATAENDSLRKTLEKLQAENTELKTTSELASPCRRDHDHASSISVTHGGRRIQPQGSTDPRLLRRAWYERTREQAVRLEDGGAFLEDDDVGMNGLAQCAMDGMVA